MSGRPQELRAHGVVFASRSQVESFVDQQRALVHVQLLPVATLTRLSLITGR